MAASKVRVTTCSMAASKVLGDMGFAHAVSELMHLQEIGIILVASCSVNWSFHDTLKHSVHIHVLGGSNNSAGLGLVNRFQFLASAEHFDPDPQVSRWEASQGLPMALNGAAVVTIGGQLFVCGGMADDDNILN